MYMLCLTSGRQCRSCDKDEQKIDSLKQHKTKSFDISKYWTIDIMLLKFWKKTPVFAGTNPIMILSAYDLNVYFYLESRERDPQNIQQNRFR